MQRRQTMAHAKSKRKVILWGDIFGFSSGRSMADGNRRLRPIAWRTRGAYLYSANLPPKQRLPVFEARGDPPGMGDGALGVCFRSGGCRAGARCGGAAARAWRAAGSRSRSGSSRPRGSSARSARGCRTTSGAGSCAARRRRGTAPRRPRRSS